MRGLAMIEKSFGAESPRVSDTLVGVIARVHAANGRVADALTTFDHALAIWPEEDPTAVKRIADGEFILVKTIWDYAPRDRWRARALAVRVRDRLRNGGAAREADLAEVNAWLASHGGAARR
jgi:hypothetical protein